MFFFFNDTATTEIYTLSLHDALPILPNTTYVPAVPAPPDDGRRVVYVGHLSPDRGTAEMIELARLLRPHGVTVELRSEEHTSELQSQSNVGCRLLLEN